MCKQGIRFFSMLLIMAMLINMLPMQVLGEALRDAMAEPEAAPTLSEDRGRFSVLTKKTQNRPLSLGYNKQFGLHCSRQIGNRKGL